MAQLAQPTHHSPVLLASFRPLFWSYRFSELNPTDDEKTIIIQLVNYGTLRHWSWLIREYGKQEIKRVLETIPATEIKPGTRELASLVFLITNWRHALRGSQ